MNRLSYSVIILLVFIAGCAVPPSLPTDNIVSDEVNSIVKSANDKKQYRSIELPNKLRVLLVSDPNTDKAAASLDVFVGSRQDPEDYQGLAHFLEHMLFLGTEKYPESGEYLTFISEHGGNHNAFTAFEHTNYFFDVDPDYLKGTLDRFSQFFIAPLFTDRYVQREKNAVNSEYLSKIKSDPRKNLDVMKTLINKDHPFSKFSVGNLDTLKGDDEQDLRNSLLDFYQKNYSANIMTLVVLGKESLPELEAMVVSRFSKVPNRNKTLIDIKEPLFIEGDLPKQVYIRPEREQRTLSMVFPIPGLTDFYKQKPTYYLGNVIGHEGKGSLFSYLKSQGWAEGLSAGSGLTYEGGAMFSISIMLTKDGVVHRDEVVQAVFQTINRIRENKNGERLFEEQKSIAATQFKFQESGQPINFVSQVSGDMHYYPVAAVLEGPYLMENFDQSLINRFLGYMKPDNVLLLLSTPDVETDSVTHFYNSNYKVNNISEQAYQQWTTARVNKEILIPQANEFIAKDFSVFPISSETAVPKILVDNDQLRLWYQQDDVFGLPKGSIAFNLRSPIANKTAREALLLKLTVWLMMDRLNEFSYPAQLAGLHYVITDGLRGVGVKISGFTEKQPLLLDKIIANIQSNNYDEKRFNNIKSEVKRQLENHSKNQPFRLLMSGLQETIIRRDWPKDDLLAVIDGIQLADLKAFQLSFMSALDIQVLVYGNYSESQAKNVSKQLTAGFLADKPKAELPAFEVAVLPVQESARKVSNDYADAALLLYIQSPGLDKADRVAMGLTAQILSSRFFSRLRTEKQLGYIVTSGPYPVWDVSGLFFVVQSPVAGPKDLQHEINNFLQDENQYIQSMSVEEFKKHRQSLVQRLSVEPKNISEQVAYYWDSIGKGYLNFDIKEQLIQALNDLNFEQWKQFYASKIINQKRAALWMYAEGNFVDQQLLETIELGDPDQFKRAMKYYSFE